MAEEQIYQQTEYTDNPTGSERIPIDVYVGGSWLTYYIDSNKFIKPTLKESSKSTDFTFTLPANARLDGIEFDSSGEVKIGTTAGGEELVYQESFTGPYYFPINKTLSKTLAKTIYVTIVSGTFNVTLDYTPNRF